MEDQALDHAHLKACLEGQGIGCSPAWLHGLIFGLVAAHDDSWEAVIDAMHQCDSSLVAASDLTHSLCHALWQSLDGPGLDFGILLPAPDRPLQERAVELSAWARGYLEGLEAAGVTGDGLPADAGQHAMEELRAIADHEGGEWVADEEQMEEAVEHTWVTAVLLRELLVVARERQ